MLNLRQDGTGGFSAGGRREDRARIQEVTIPEPLMVTVHKVNRIFREELPPVTE